jgi:predicted chitinase
VAVTLSDIDRWDASAISGVFEVAQHRTQTMAVFGQDLDDAKKRLTDWQGQAGQAFAQEWGKVRTDIDATGQESQAVANAVARAEVDIGKVITKWRQIQDAAYAAQLTITPDGHVINPNFNARDMSLQRESIRESLQGRLDQMMIDANKADEELATAIRAAVGDEAVNADGTPDGPAGAPAAPPPSGITLEQLRQIMPNLSPETAAQYLPMLNAAMAEGQINTPQRRAAFLAQLAEESVQLQHFEEFANGNQYEGRLDLGNTQPGDGPRFKGRGPIQITGRSNYQRAGQALGLDLIDNPELAARPDVGFRTAEWYWTTHNLNAVADAGPARFDDITRAINGGLTGKAQRDMYYNRALQVLGAR